MDSMASISSCCSCKKSPIFTSLKTPNPLNINLAMNSHNHIPFCCWNNASHIRHGYVLTAWIIPYPFYEFVLTALVAIRIPNNQTALNSFHYAISIVVEPKNRLPLYKINITIEWKRTKYNCVALKRIHSETVRSRQFIFTTRVAPDTDLAGYPAKY